MPFQQQAGKGLGFYTGQDGYLYCDNLRVEDIRKQVLRCSALAALARPAAAQCSALVIMMRQIWM